MPRIRHWKELNLCRPLGEHRYFHIESLFNTQAEWHLIETMLPDMLRVALSIKAGTIGPSTILRRLATYSRKNTNQQTQQLIDFSSPGCADQGGVCALAGVGRQVNPGHHKVH